MTPRNFPRTWTLQALTRKAVGDGRGARGELGVRRARGSAGQSRLERGSSPSSPVVCEGKSKPAISLLLPSLKQVPELRPQLTEIVQATQRGAKARRRGAGRTNCASLRASCALDSTLPRLLRCSLRLFFRKIFILQLVELVLTYNFTDCDFKNIKDIYQDVIHPELNVYINGTKSIRFNKFVYCEDAGGKANWERGPGNDVRGTPCGVRASALSAAPRTCRRGRSESSASPFSLSALCSVTHLLPSPSLGSFSSAHPRPLSSCSNRLCSVSRSSPSPRPPPSLPLSLMSYQLSFFFSLAFSSFLVNFAACEQPDCLIKIEHFTFKPIYGCASLAKETFAKQTNATLSLRCSGYSGIQINNTQTMKKRRKREVKTDKCLEQVSYLIELWRRFSRIS
ncbi:thymic stromal lymphopoietin [Tursiops truncatus]|uniref:Thymic stromal lymphopoietin n=2 Tax=Delphinidae TaxID=9726 RepID=A0A6J3RAV3_TURTR|nr:thymic stromal lymphopoietin [Tursiops truncatus]